MEEIDMYLEDLFTQSWFHPDEFEILKEERRPILMSRIIAALSLKLQPFERAQLEMYLKTGDVDNFRKICSENIENYEEYFVSILKEFEDDYLENFEN